ncbi:MAG: hypothetical protein JWN40_2070, partial [Phycisphaerales bacterium]|nr:hypothetical protein [Phycisphaerales bacterium]
MAIPTRDQHPVLVPNPTHPRRAPTPDARKCTRMHGFHQNVFFPLPIFTRSPERAQRVESGYSPARIKPTTLFLAAWLFGSLASLVLFARRRTMNPRPLNSTPIHPHSPPPKPSKTPRKSAIYPHFLARDANQKHRQQPASQSLTSNPSPHPRAREHFSTPSPLSLMLTRPMTNPSTAMSVLLVLL